MGLKDLSRTFLAQFPQIQGLNMAWFETQINLVNYCFNTENFDEN